MEFVLRIHGLYLGKIFVNMHLHQMPIIQPGPLQMLVINGKPQGLHQMQLYARSSAQAGNIAGIAGNFRLNQYNVHRLSPAAHQSQSAVTTAPLEAEVVSLA